jgi:hypothetical protein
MTIKKERKKVVLDGRVSKFYRADTVMQLLGHPSGTEYSKQQEHIQVST